MTANFRERSLSVRFDAATRLRLLRQERLARRRGMPAEPPPAPAAGLTVSADTLRLLAEDPAEEMLAEAEAETLTELPPEPLAEVTEDVTEPEPSVAEDPTEGMVEDLAAPEDLSEPADPSVPEEPSAEAPEPDLPDELGAPPEESLAASPPPMPQPEPEPEPEPTASETDTAEVAPEVSDLNRLPGIGSGLIWLFGQCGIRSLEDLGRADPDDLAGKLGLVGHLIDLSAFAALARRLHGSPEPIQPDQTRTSAQPQPNDRSQPLERVD